MIDWFIRLILGSTRYHEQINAATATVGRSQMARRHALKMKLDVAAARRHAEEN